MAEKGPDLLEHDAPLAARGMFVSPVHPEMGPAPLVGEHTEAVLREVVGLSEEEIAELIVNEVV